MTRPYQPKTGQKCHCKPGVHRDNCPDCEGTGWRIDFAAIRAKTSTYPLKDGQVFTCSRYGQQTVAGEIKPEHSEPVCWTLQGNWYRRSDGERMTGWNGEVMTETEFYRRRLAGVL